jgi:hypothetical protein
MRSSPRSCARAMGALMVTVAVGCGGDGGGGGAGAGGGGALGGAGGTAGMGAGGAGGSVAGPPDGAVAGTGGGAPGTDGGANDGAGPADGSAGAPAPAPGGGTWESLAPLPATRQEFGVAEVGGHVFVVGGLNPRADRVESYDPAANSWALHPDLPVALDHPNVAGAAGKLYVFGGTQSGNTFEYDPAVPPAERRWVLKAAMPTRRAAAAIGVLGSKVFVAGGNGSGSTANPAFEIYDAATDTWQSSARNELPPLPAGRNHVPGAVVDGRFYVIGGRLGGRFDGLQSRVDMYDPASRQWTSRAPMPTPRGGSAAGVIDGLVVVVGGEGNMAPGNMGVFPQTELYDAVTDRWTTMKPMMTPRHGMGAAVIAGKLYVPAGGTIDGGANPVALVEAFSLR